MNQTKLGSFYEALMNVAIGAVVALLTQLAVFPTEDIHITWDAQFRIMMWFTVISVIRSYVVRRWFNKRLHAAAQRLAS